MPIDYLQIYRLSVKYIQEDGMGKYKSRLVDKRLKSKLGMRGAVLIQGPKWCGKTTTAEQCSKSILYMDEPEQKQQNIQMAEISPQLLLAGKTPRLIDEWQLAPQLWDAVRFEVDHRKEKGQFILTGSSVPANFDLITHTGTGRFSWLTMRNMSLFESGDSSGEVKLAELFDEEVDISGTNEIDITKLAFIICRGGWPDAIDMNFDAALESAYDYVDAVINLDISRVDDVKRDPERVRRVMQSLARNQGSQIPFATIARDISTNEIEFTAETVSLYIKALKKIFVVEDMPSWNPNLRSKTSIRSTETRYYGDSAIASAVLGIGPKDLLNDLNTMGLLFETMCVRDLRVYAENIDGKVYHYRDRSGLECDAVIHLRNGQYGLVEIKLGGNTLIEEGARNLHKLESLIDKTRMSKPAFKMVLTGTDKYAYKRPDDIMVVPIGCLTA